MFDWGNGLRKRFRSHGRLDLADEADGLPKSEVQPEVEEAEEEYLSIDPVQILDSQHLWLQPRVLTIRPKAVFACNRLATIIGCNAVKSGHVDQHHSADVRQWYMPQIAFLMQKSL